MGGRIGRRTCAEKKEGRGDTTTGSLRKGNQKGRWGYFLTESSQEELIEKYRRVGEKGKKYSPSLIKGGFAGIWSKREDKSLSVTGGPADSVKRAFQPTVILPKSARGGAGHCCKGEKKGARHSYVNLGIFKAASKGIGKAEVRERQLV